MAFNIGAAGSGAAAGMAAGAALGPWGAAAGGALGALGGFQSSSKKGIDPWIQMLAQQNFEREKMKNAHQWETKDLIKAGLNPALTAAGASAPAIAGAGSGGGAAMAAGNNTRVNAQESSANRSINSAFQAANLFDAVKRTQDQARLTDSDIAANESSVRNTDADTTIKLLESGFMRKYGDQHHKNQLANELLSQQLTAARIGETNQMIKESVARTAGHEIANATNKPKAIDATNEQNFRDKHPVMAGMIQGAKDIMDVAPNFINAVKGGRDILSAARGMEEYETTTHYNSMGLRTGETSRRRVRSRR